MAIRLRTKKLIYSAAAGAAGMLLICSSGGYFFYQKAEEREIALKHKYQEQVKELELVAVQNETAFALLNDVKKGEKITEDMLQKVHLPKAAAANDLFNIMLYDEKTNSFYTKTDLPAHTVLTHSLLYQDEMITTDVREGEYAFIQLPTTIKKDQYVDVRIQFPSGDDYILLSKKRVKDVQGITVWLDMDEGEILSMSSAMVDAYIEGGKIYAMAYVDEHMQDPSQMTYPVKTNVKELIQASPNIVNLAKLNLETQNRARLEQALKNTDTSQREAVRNGDLQTEDNVQTDKEKRSAEERVNALNDQAQTEDQQQLVGGNE